MKTNERYMGDRRTKVKKAIAKRPTGTTASISGLLVIVADKLGVPLTAVEAAAIVGGLSSLVSIVYTPPE